MHAPVKVENEAAKKAKFAYYDELMRKGMKELQESGIAVDIGKTTELNPDVASNKSAEESIILIEKVMSFLQREHFAAAETLLRHIYRITPSQAARIALANARKLCHAAIVAENKWVRRRATLLRRKADKADIRAEKKKYISDNRQRIIDLLTTAMLEIAEGIERRGGEFFAKMHSMFEVILPPITDDSGMVLARAPLSFSTKSSIDERSFKDVMQKIHDIDPGLKKLERGFYTCNNVPIVGFEKKIEKDKQLTKFNRQISEKIGHAVNIVNICVTHHSSKLFWYVFDFPAQPETLNFADTQLVEDYGDANMPLLGLEGKLSRDEFVKLRDAQRKKRQSMLTMQQKSAREKFERDNIKLYGEIDQINGSLNELDEVIDQIKVEFGRLTSIDVTEEGLSIHGLAISGYKKLYVHMQRMYNELATLVPHERDRLHEQLFNDRLQAREYYYDYREMSMRRAQLAERRAFLTLTIEQYRDIARGSGKKLAQMSLF